MTASVSAVLDEGSDGTNDAVVDYLGEVLTSLGGLTCAGGETGDAVRVDRIAMLERIKAAASAAQAAETVKFARSQVAAQRDAQVDPRRLGRGIADQLAMACKVGSWEGSRRLTLARDLWFDLPAVYDLLTRGEVSEYVALLVARETSHLDPELRRLVDKQVVAGGLERMAPKEAAVLARKLAYEADPQGALQRGRRARKDRRVTLRPAPDTMSNLTALLPVEQGVACWAALRKHSDSLKATGDSRSRDQIMADTLVERLTGQRAAEDVDTEIQIVMPVDALLDPDSPAPSHIPGIGPIPAGLAHEILYGGSGHRTWRRLFTAPAGADGECVVIGGDSSARRFTGWLAKLLRFRDRYCRDPYCTAPIRHLDHIVAHRDGGPTTYANGRGVCERHNYVRELPGWKVEILNGCPHTLRVTTPTGHSYDSRPPDP